MNTNKQGMNKKTQMYIDMTQFGATHNQKKAQARTLLWGKYIKFQPCFVSARGRSNEHKAMGRLTTMKMTATSRGFPD